MSGAIKNSKPANMLQSIIAAQLLSGLTYETIIQKHLFNIFERNKMRESCIIFKK